jgi:hypothetical protein
VELGAGLLKRGIEVAMIEGSTATEEMGGRSIYTQSIARESSRHLGRQWFSIPELKHQSHLNNFRPKVISKFSDVRNIAKYRRCYPRNVKYQYLLFVSCNAKTVRCGLVYF